ncbi:MAG: ribbon-helix-helix domain-containing protein [Thermoplasmatota archaeon]
MSKTERVTIRLPSAMTAKMDALVDLGQYGTRTEVMRHALRQFFEDAGGKADKTMEAEEKMQKLVKLAAVLKENQDLLDAL